MMKRYITSFLAAMAFAAVACAQPAFKGGSNALNSFINGHIVYPEYSSQNCIAATIQVSFKVGKSGQVSDVKIYKGLGIDLDDEAIRVVKMTSGRWIVPAGIEGPSTLVLPISFTPDNAHCSGVYHDINAAVAEYRNRQALEDAVTNYYQNKYLGKADTTKENKIIALKKQLGFDEELIADLLEHARQKLKQGDRDGACADCKFIRNIGSNKADQFIAEYCK